MTGSAAVSKAVRGRRAVGVARRIGVGGCLGVGRCSGVGGCLGVGRCPGVDGTNPGVGDRQQRDGDRHDPWTSQDLEPRHGDRTGGQLHGFARSDQVVRAPALHLDRRHRTRHLHQRAGESGNARPDVRLGQPVDGPGRHHHAVGVIGVGLLTQPDRREIGLVGQSQMPEQLGRPVDGQHQQAGRHRVQGAGVSDPTGPQHPPQSTHHVVRRASGRLVDQQQPTARRQTRGRSVVGRSTRPAFGHRSAFCSGECPVCLNEMARDHRSRRVIAGVGLNDQHPHRGPGWACGRW